jgi:hypothetical protein
MSSQEVQRVHIWVQNRHTTALVTSQNTLLIRYFASVGLTGFEPATP